MHKWLTAGVLLAACTVKTPTSSAPPPSSAPSKGPRTSTQNPNPVVQVASHADHSCVLRRAGDVHCWGKNTYGQLGDGRRQDNLRQTKVVGLRDAIRVEVGTNFSCALQRSGQVVCWGNNEDGQLGDGRGAEVGAMSYRPVTVAGLRDIKQISLGDYHGCALDSRGVVSCWGNAENGQLGSDQRRAFPSPLRIDRLENVQAIASGAAHVCALQRDGAVWCWGRNTEGQLGDGKSGSRIKAVRVAGLSDAVALASGHTHTCALRRSKTLACWGGNAFAQLGPGAQGASKRDTPVAVPGLSQIAEIAGGGRHTCVRLASGRAVCWGANDHGQLGHQSAATRRAQPTPVRGIADATDLALGADHSCALRRAGEVTCWGSAEHGAIGARRLALLLPTRSSAMRRWDGTR